MSFILAQILKKKVPGWCEKVFIEDEVLQICQHWKVRPFKDETIKAKGEYTIHEKQAFILYRPGLKREIFVWVLLHELGHHLLHAPVSHKFSRSIYRRMDREANFFAAIALMPTWLVESKTWGEIIEEYNYPLELIKIRKEIYDTFKI
ncbi:MAG: ImmA/IrrE family metallo-endopeptidase [Acidobacteria bacterium]|nr:ImmA/IrrE family metallo-endopeptidase [Acidobacteriota bacterium]